MSLILLYFLHSTSVLSFYIDVVLTLFMERAAASTFEIGSVLLGNNKTLMLILMLMLPMVVVRILVWVLESLNWQSSLLQAMASSPTDSRPLHQPDPVMTKLHAIWCQQATMSYLTGVSSVFLFVHTLAYSNNEQSNKNPLWGSFGPRHLINGLETQSGQ